ncbi:MAG: hypothetical protein JSR85_02050 [Proteobacteria bacterium]|nr:hypothetical protein [Pseudomonadota bacterium]
MPVYLIFSCEVIVFSFLIGAFRGSSTLGFTILGSSSLIIYFLFQRLYTPLPLVWGVTILSGIATLLWVSYIDTWLGTNFIAIILSFIVGGLCYIVNDRFFKKYHV